MASPRASRAIQVAFGVLIVAGIAAAYLRATHRTDLTALIEPFRLALIRSFGVVDGNAALRADAVVRADAKYASHALATFLHIGTGALVFLLLPLQFSKTVRTRYRELHRWTGRVVIVVGIVSMLGGLYFGLWHPFAGTIERVMIAGFGAWFLLAICIAYRMIRARRVAEHREWMIRAMAVALAISTVRFMALPVDLVLTPFGYGPESVFIHSVWIGWIGTIAAAEWWIRKSRPAFHESVYSA